MPVTATSTPINADEIFCLEDKTLWSHTKADQTIDASSPPSPQTAPATDTLKNNEATRECPRTLPQILDAIKYFIQHDEDADYISLRSAIALKDKKRMLFLSIEFSNVKRDSLVDSGAYNKAISERDAEEIKQSPIHGIINKAPPPPFKLQYAIAELEHALATYTMQFKIGDYTFEETFIEMSHTSFSILGMAFLRKPSAILDTAQEQLISRRSKSRWHSRTRCRYITQS